MRLLTKLFAIKEFFMRSIENITNLRGLYVEITRQRVNYKVWVMNYGNNTGFVENAITLRWCNL